MTAPCPPRPWKTISIRVFEATIDTFPELEIQLPHITVLTEENRGSLGEGFEFGFDGRVFVAAVVDLQLCDDS